MLVPLIDLMGGKVVQIIHGEIHPVEDLAPWIERFKKYPTVQVVDVDAALKQGDNRPLVERLCKELHCQVGGGVRNVEDAKRVLAYGAKRVVVGSAIFREGRTDIAFADTLCQAVGRKCVVLSFDAQHGRVMISGRREILNLSAEDAMKALEPYCVGYFYTNIDTGSSMGGFPVNLARELRESTKRQLMVAGGIHSMDEVAQLDAMEIDSVVGAAIYRGAIQA